MKAKLLLYEKQKIRDYVYEVVIWQLPKITKERHHGLKYRLYFGDQNGCLVRYDNEHGKVDHKHYREKNQLHTEIEEPYSFIGIEQLLEEKKI